MGPVIRRVLLYIVYLIAVVVLVGAIIYAFGSKDKDDDANKPETGNTSQGQTVGTQSTQAGSSVTNGTTGTSTQTTNTTPSTTTTATTAQTSAQLSNSGPGEVFTLFAVSSLVGFGVYRYLLVKRVTQ